MHPDFGKSECQVGLEAVQRREAEAKRAFEAEWARCAPWIEAALDVAETHGIDDVKAMVERRESRFWAGRQCAAVTDVQVWPRARWLLIWLAGGDRAELEDQMLPKMEAYGREQGCSKAFIVGRPGWARTLKTRGYGVAAVTVTREL